MGRGFFVYLQGIETSHIYKGWAMLKSGFLCTYRGLKLTYIGFWISLLSCFLCTYRGLKLQWWYHLSLWENEFFVYLQGIETFLMQPGDGYMEVCFLCTYRGLKLMFKVPSQVCLTRFLCTYRGLKLQCVQSLRQVCHTVFCVPIGY